MKCLDLQSNLTLFADGYFSESETVSVKGHLAACPLCRQKYSEYHEIRSTLRQMRRPEITADLRSIIKDSVRSERRFEKQSLFPVSSAFREWLQMRAMPYGVAVLSSVLIAVTFLTMMFSVDIRPLQIAAVAGYPSEMLASNRDPFREIDVFVVSASDYAQTRLAFSNESPSINPQGALIALTKSLVRGGMKNDEVVVVADVFSNGVARVTQVVEPSRDREAVAELEKALESDSGNSPFLPANMDVRPENMRVVLKFQSVDVNTGLASIKSRL